MIDVRVQTLETYTYMYTYSIYVYPHTYTYVYTHRLEFGLWRSMLELDRC